MLMEYSEAGLAPEEVLIVDNTCDGLSPDFAPGIRRHRAPEPPFNSGTPDSAPPQVAETVRRAYAALTRTREQTAKRVADRLGVNVAEDRASS